MSIAENFLYMMRGEKAEAEEARMFDIALILHADHELNASTFTTRVIAGTLADIYGAVTGGIAALAGPLARRREYERDENAQGNRFAKKQD